MNIYQPLHVPPRHLTLSGSLLLGEVTAETGDTYESEIGAGDLSICQRKWGAGYSNFPCDDVPLSMPTPWKWATHTEDEVGLEKTSFLGLEWSGAQSRVPLHSHGGFLQALCAVCCQIQGWAWSDEINECITHHVRHTNVTAHLAEWKLLSLCQNRNNHPEKVCPHKMLNVFKWQFHPENIRYKTEIRDVILVSSYW